MKKLYRKGTVHPSLPITADHLSFLPAAIFTLATALSPEDREVLAYLIYRSNDNSFIIANFSSTRRQQSDKNIIKSRSDGHRDHPPHFSCDCFKCYMSYWVRWDSSPSRQLIHEIIDAFEEGLAESKRGKGRKERRRRAGGARPHESKRTELKGEGDPGELDSVDESSGGGGGECGGDVVGEGVEKGSVGRFVSFIGERIWGVWGQ